MSLYIGKEKSQYIIFLDALKHKLMSVIQMCDKGYDVTFVSQYCEIKSMNMVKIVSKAMRTSNILYIIKEENEECYLGKIDESWV